jgi:hypothetical protein
MVRKLVGNTISRTTTSYTRRIPTLIYESINDPMEDDTVIELFIHEEFEISRSNRHFGVECPDPFWYRLLSDTLIVHPIRIKGLHITLLKERSQKAKSSL